MYLLYILCMLWGRESLNFLLVATITERKERVLAREFIDDNPMVELAPFSFKLSEKNFVVQYMDMHPA